jgi:hypothetical protein
MELKNNFLDICKEKDSYCKFPSLYPRKSVGRQRNAGSSRDRKFLMGFKPCGLKAGEFCHLPTYSR